MRGNVNIARVAGAGGGLLAGALSVAGILLIPVTFGGSLGLTVAGVTLGVAAGGGGLGAAIFDKYTKNSKTKELKVIIHEEYERTRDIHRVMDRMIKHQDEIKRLIR